MSQDAAKLLERFAAGRYKPATFLERGVALPFTAPPLMGARIRPAERGRPELVLANPAGLEGAYVIPWAAILDFCTPTLHDRALWEKVSAQSLLTPRTVRAAARSIASQGYAGREAARAAAAAIEAESQGRILTNYHLLMALVRQGEADGSGAGLPPPEQDTPTQVERRARAVLERLRGQGSLSPARAVDLLEELAMAFSGIGLRRDPTGARLPRSMAEIATMTREVAAWSAGSTAEDRLCARLLMQGAELTLRCGRIALDKALALLDDLWRLLCRWSLAPDEVLDLIARPEWLLDGWELICGLWRASPPGHQASALLDMACMVPVIPAEAARWVGTDPAQEMETHRDGLRRWRRMVQPNQDWLTGRILDLTQRNEAARAMAA